MADRISSCPDSILCYILSFLPTKQVGSTSVLSKRWNLLWHSVPSLDFDYPDGMYDDGQACNRFILSLYSFLLWRDKEKTFHRFRLRFKSLYNHNEMETWIKLAIRRSGSLKHLNLSLHPGIAVPSVVFSCTTLVVLKLSNLMLKNISFVHLPFLIVLHLNSIYLSKDVDLPQFLSGCLNLVDLEVFNTVSDSNVKEFHSLPSLLRAEIDPTVVPLEVVKNVEILFADRLRKEDLVCDLQNLVQLEFAISVSSQGWPCVLEVFRCCPKLQNVFILIDGDLEAVLPYPLTVPTCISLHLQFCCLECYSGSALEFQFAEYIMLNANYLQIMEFRIDSDLYNNLLRRHHMIRDLSSCRKISYACTLLFEKL